MNKYEINFKGNCREGGGLGQLVLRGRLEIDGSGWVAQSHGGRGEISAPLESGDKFKSSGIKYWRPSQQRKQDSERTVSPGGTAGGNRKRASTPSSWSLPQPHGRRKVLRTPRLEADGGRRGRSGVTLRGQGAGVGRGPCDDARDFAHFQKFGGVE